MLLKELRDWVNKLPVEMDEFVVVTREIKMDEEDLNKINQLIISTVESKTDAKIRS